MSKLREMAEATAKDLGDEHATTLRIIEAAFRSLLEECLQQCHTTCHCVGNIMHHFGLDEEKGA